MYTYEEQCTVIQSSIPLISYDHILHMTENKKNKRDTPFFQLASPSHLCYGGKNETWTERIFISHKPEIGGKSGGARGGSQGVKTLWNIEHLAARGRLRNAGLPTREKHPFSKIIYLYRRMVKVQFLSEQTTLKTRTGEVICATLSCNTIYSPRLFFDPEDRGSKFLRNITQLLPHWTASNSE